MSIEMQPGSGQDGGGYRWAGTRASGRANAIKHMEKTVKYTVAPKIWLDELNR